MTEDAVELEPAFNLSIALLGAKAVVGSQDQNVMTAQAQGFRDRLTMIVECAGMMRRVFIGFPRFLRER